MVNHTEFQCSMGDGDVPVCDRHLPTSLYRGQGPSSASGPSLMPARLHGTHCRAISVKQSILLVLGALVSDAKDALFYLRLRRCLIFTTVLSPF